VDGREHDRAGLGRRPPRARRSSPATQPSSRRQAHRRLGVRPRLGDDATRLAYVEVLADEKATTAAAFLKRAIAFYASHGISIRRVMTDNGPAYRSTVHAFACRALEIRHLTTRPYRPRTNGKAERFIRTLLAGWAYCAIYGSSRERTAALDGWLWTYDHRRLHGSLSHNPPIARLNDLNNLAGPYS
jgi:transposase InsO family protein